MYTALPAVSAEGARDFLAQGQLHSLLGAILGLQGKAREALESHDEALRLIRSCDARTSEAEALNDLADTLRALGRAAESLERYEQALALALRVNNRYQQARAHRGIALTHQDDTTARSHAAQARQLYADLGLPGDELPAQSVLGTPTPEAAGAAGQTPSG